MSIPFNYRKSFCIQKLTHGRNENAKIQGKGHNYLTNNIAKGFISDQRALIGVAASEAVRGINCL